MAFFVIMNNICRLSIELHGAKDSFGRNLYRVKFSMNLKLNNLFMVKRRTTVKLLRQEDILLQKLNEL